MIQRVSVNSLFIKHWPFILVLLISLCSNIIAGNKPIVLKTDKGWFFPALNPDGYSKDFLLHQLHADSSVLFMLAPPIPYSPTDINLNEAGQPPLSVLKNGSHHSVHLLGTDTLGRDLLSNIIHGFRTSLFISILAIAIALALGIIIGALSGFYYGSTFFIGFRKFLALILLSAFAINTVFVLATTEAALIFMLLSTILYAGFALLILKSKTKRPKKIQIPMFSVSLDGMLMGTINFFSALPSYFVLLALLTIIPNPGITGISIALGVLMWTEIARLTRAEIIRIKQTNMFEATQSLGYSTWRIIFKHLLPNAIQPAFATIGFGIGGAILAEAFLSFIGIAPAEMISWGNSLAEARAYPHFWWLSVFPGLTVFLMILLFYKQAEKFDQNSIQVH